MIIRQWIILSTLGMGEMLGRLHWLASYDGRDIEFVMGGAAFSITKSPVRNSIISYHLITGKGNFLTNNK